MTRPARITSASSPAPFRLRLVFQDGLAGEADLGPLLARRAGLLAELRDPALFQQVRLDPEAGTVAWPNGVDLDPDVLHALVSGAPGPVPE